MDYIDILQKISFVIGIAYLWLEYKANPWLWLLSVIQPIISMWLFWQKGIYAEFCIHAYYVLIAVYGLWYWLRGSGGKKGADRPITHIPAHTAALCAGAATLFWLVIYWILVRFTDSSAPVTDSLSTALSIVGMWMLARKYAEQWLVWIVVDAICVYLYAVKGLNWYALRYAIYTVVAAFGYRRWLRQMPPQTEGVATSR